MIRPPTVDGLIYLIQKKITCVGPLISEFWAIPIYHTWILDIHVTMYIVLS